MLNTWKREQMKTSEVCVFHDCNDGTERYIKFNPPIPESCKIGNHRWRKVFCNHCADHCAFCSATRVFTTVNSKQETNQRSSFFYKTKKEYEELLAKHLSETAPKRSLFDFFRRK